ncbi:hypothetical protein [Arthrobacter koreensis]|uniref:hypothetical protein n=1 Tax=Arthrobacter koreensis TaxID=199136 RepID=UPI002DB5B7BF|nr:hypothetical protein [Arthrobacter koreensis]MEB7448950.1 hypothetical protein [Arthrobacter koreensis]
MTRRAVLSHRATRYGAMVGAVGAQASQALGSFLILAVAARSLDLGSLGLLSVLYGLLVLSAATTSGFVGDSLTVLNRQSNAVRAGLQVWLFLLSAGCAVAVPLVVWALGLVDPMQAFLLGLAIAAYLIEDVVRRVHMACLLFQRIVLMDLTVIAAALLLLLVLGERTELTVTSFLAAIAVGQAAGAVAGVVALPVVERVLVSLRGAQWRTVAAYGTWRAAQQALRPALLTALRSAVVLLVAFEASGALELARVYAAPAMLVVGGISSYLFASFARARTVPLGQLLRRADRGVLALLCMTAVCTAVALAALPAAGPLLLGSLPELTAVAGWLAYTAAVSAATPYGVLAAVRSSPSRIFLIRSADTVVSLGAVVLVVHFTANAALAPLAAAFGAALGGVAIRQILLVPLRTTETKNIIVSTPHERELEKNA